MALEVLCRPPCRAPASAGGACRRLPPPPRSDSDDRENTIIFCRDAFEKTLSAIDYFLS